jgi:hypothetical protein
MASKKFQWNQLHDGDCVAGLRQIPDGSVDLAFADPPFNIGYDYDSYDDRLASDHYLDWCRKWMGEVVRALKGDGTFWLAIGDEYAAELKVLMQRELGLTCRSWVVWYYTFGVNCKNKFNRSHVHLFHMVKDAKRFTFNVPDVSIPSARQLVYGDRRANPRGRLPDDTWILRPQDLPEGFAADGDTSRESAARSKSARAGMAARCRSSCWGGSFAPPATLARKCSIPSAAAARRWSWPKSSVANMLDSNFPRTTPRKPALGWRRSTSATP